MTPGDTHSASSKPSDRSVPESLRAALAERYGPVYTGAEADRQLLALDVFATCGDLVTRRAIELDHLPLVGIVDYKTRRNEPIPQGTFERLGARRTVRVENPPGVLSEALRAAVRDLVATGGGLIEVDGEEDLGSLALVEALPAGATVIYGIPGAGVSFVRVDAAAKDNVRQLLAKMER
jgi:GTP-dependent dephospho-CoA kinase